WLSTIYRGMEPRAIQDAAGEPAIHGRRCSQPGAVGDLMSGAPEDESHHEPVLLDEVLSFLRPGEGGLFIDCTVGLGGHTEAILEASPEAEVIGLDRDLESLQLARARLARFGRRFIDVQANFKDLETVLDRLGAGRARGILADLGISSHQLD